MPAHLQTLAVAELPCLPTTPDNELLRPRLCIFPAAGMTTGSCSGAWDACTAYDLTQQWQRFRQPPVMGLWQPEHGCSMQKLSPDAMMSHVTSQTMDLPMPVAVVSAQFTVSLIPPAQAIPAGGSLSPTSTQGKLLLSCSGLKIWSLDAAKIAARASEWSMNYMNQPCIARTSAGMGTRHSLGRQIVCCAVLCCAGFT